MATQSKAAREPEMQEWNDEWLVRRGNYLTTITPALAKDLLERNTNNRRPKLRSIGQYARDMEAGKWDPDASDLKFSRTGELIDGQNRLLACLQAGKSFPTLIRTGLSLSAKAHVDTGVKRTVADMLKMEGVSGQPTVVGAACSLWYRYEDRVLNHGGRRLTNVSGGGRAGQQYVMTHEEVLTFLQEHPTIDQYALHASSLRNRVMPALPPSAILAFLAMAATKDEALLRDMIERLGNGEYGGPDDPLPLLVQYAAMVRGNTGNGSPGHRGRVLQESVVLAMTRVWNAMRGGDPIKGRLHIKVTDTLVLPL